MIGKVNRCESLLNVVTANKPKGLTGLNQNGKWSGVGAIKSPTVDAAPPAERRDLPQSWYLLGNVVSP